MHHLLFDLVCNGEKAGEIIGQAISGGKVRSFITLNLHRCHQKITFVLPKKGPESRGKLIE